MSKMNRKQLEIHKRKLKKEQEKCEFIDQMHQILDLWGGEGTFALFPKNNIECSYSLRVLPLKITATNHPDIKEKALYNLHRTLERLIRVNKVGVELSGILIPINVFISAGHTVILLLSHCQTIATENEWAKEVVARTGGQEKIELIWQKSGKILFELMNMVYCLFFDMGTHHIWFKHELTESPKYPTHQQHMLDINEVSVDLRHFSTSDGKRSAFKVCWPKSQEGIIYSEIQPSLFGEYSDPDDKPVPVYIQRHAMNRLMERLDGMRRYEIQYCLFDSVSKPILIRQGKNKMLIAYKIADSKLGYLVAEHLNGAILIHTFLFITNNGTPEGQKLTELTGLGKLDKKYLAIDKLSCFLRSDIAKNERLSALFIQVGCSSLLTISDAVNNLKTKQPELQMSQFIIEYLDKRNTLPKEDELTMNYCR
jgi:hypothetical protein